MILIIDLFVAKMFVFILKLLVGTSHDKGISILIDKYA